MRNSKVVEWLVRLEPLWILGLGVVLLLPDRFWPAALSATPVLRGGIVFGGVMVVWALRWAVTGRFSRRTPLDLPLLLILLWLPVNLWAAPDKELAVEATFALLYSIVIFYTFGNWDVPGAWLGGILLGFAFLLALVAPFVGNLALSEFFTIPGVTGLLARLNEAVPGVVNQNRIAAALAIFLPLAVAMVADRREEWKWRIAGATVMVVAGGALLLTQSRGGVAAALLGLILLLPLRWPRLFWVGIPLAVAGGLVLWLGDVRTSGILLSDPVLGGFEGRLELWSRAIYALEDFPFTGIGIGNFPRVIPLLYPLFLIAPSSEVQHAHNLLLQVGVDLGYPGLIAYVAAHLAVLFLLARLVLRRPVDRHWTVAAGILAGLLAMFAHGLIDAAFWGSRVAFVPWMLLGAGVALVRKRPPTAEG